MAKRRIGLLVYSMGRLRVPMGWRGTRQGQRIRFISVFGIQRVISRIDLGLRIRTGGPGNARTGVIRLTTRRWWRACWRILRRGTLMNGLRLQMIQTIKRVVLGLRSRSLYSNFFGSASAQLMGNGLALAGTLGGIGCACTY
jgi:hypothetical protein